MSLYHHPPPKLTVAVFGKGIQSKNDISKMILGNSTFVSTTNNFVVETNDSFKIIINHKPDFFDEEYLHPDQLIIDFMALSHPGPDLFILAIAPENTQEEEVAAQIFKLQESFGEKVTEHLFVMLPDRQSFDKLSHLGQCFSTRLVNATENLANKCKEWCSTHRPFCYDYKHYSEEVVKTRRTALKRSYFRYDGNPQKLHGDSRRAGTDRTSSSRAAAPEHHIGDRTDEVSGDPFNIVLLGLTGTGKSASANTILAAGNSQLDSKQRFKSEPSSVPVTTQCEFRIMEKPLGTRVRVVDTPDFFHEQLGDSETQVEECKKYCQPGQYVVLLVLQLGRLTVFEQGILEKLENKLGLKIRERTILLLTHGEDLKGDPEQFIKASAHLKSIVDLCGCGYQLFNNTSKNTKQVKDLFKKIPENETIFPKSPKGNNIECCIC